MRPAPSPARSCPGAPLPTATSVGAIKRSSGAVPFHQGCRSRGTGGPMAEASRCSLPRNAIRRRAHQPTAPPDFLGDLPRGGASVRWPRPAPPSVTRNVAEPAPTRGVPPFRSIGEAGVSCIRPACRTAEARTERHRCRRRPVRHRYDPSLRVLFPLPLLLAKRKEKNVGKPAPDEGDGPDHRNPSRRRHRSNRIRVSPGAILRFSRSAT